MNGTRFGPGADIWAATLEHAGHFKCVSQSGLVMVKQPTAGLDSQVPFRRRMGRGHGPREHNPASPELYKNGKTAYVDA